MKYTVVWLQKETQNCNQSNKINKTSNHSTVGLSVVSNTVMISK